MIVFNNCDELIEGLIAMRNNDGIGRTTVTFQGDECEILGGHPSSEDIKEGIFIINDRNPQYVFLVGPEHHGLISVYLYMSPFKLDETIYIDIPSYVRSELIATLNGDWY